MRRTLLSLASCAPLLATACDYGAFPLGGDETDGFLIADAAPTAHLGKALDGGDTLTFRSLFEQGNALVFDKTPDPSPLLSATNVLDDERARAGRVPVSMLTYNVGLLDAHIFGVIPYAQTPDLERRRGALPGLIFSQGTDLILCQEVWLPEDIAEFTRTAEEFGYRAFTQDRSGHDDGLMTFVKSDILLPGSTPSFAFAAYAAQDPMEFFPGPKIQRGWNSVSFEHRDVGPIIVFNTHMKSFPESWIERAKQARELGILLRTAVEEEGHQNDLVLVGGDMNAGPYYKTATWKTPEDGEQTVWFHNTISYPLLLAYGELVDLAIMGRPAADAVADVTLGDTVVNDPSKALVLPGADDGWCERTPKTTFTGTDCNSLYFEQYAGTEFPARLDHLLARDPEGRIVVSHSGLAFTEPLRFGDTVVEPSDHYGVLVDLVIARP